MTVTLTDLERQLLIVLVMKAWVDIRVDPEMQYETKELESILRKINGVDKQVIIG